MNHNRRGVLIGASGMILAAGLAGCGETEEQAAPADSESSAASEGMVILRIFTAEDGSSQAERVTVAAAAKELPASSVLAANSSPTYEDWHPTPDKTLSLKLSGLTEVTVSDGTVHQIRGGEMVYFEDMTGEGHISEVVEGGVSVLLTLPDDFDFMAWASEA